MFVVVAYCCLLCAAFYVSLFLWCSYIGEQH